MTVTAPVDLGYNRVCNVEDFSHPQLREVLRDVFAHELDRFGPDFPTGHEYRKQWEVAMGVRTFRDHGLLDGTKQFIGVGAGNEPTCFYLTRHARRVHATDLYLDPRTWGAFTDRSMVEEPERHWPFPWNPRRLVVQHMDAMDLRYEDDSFDGVFSSSSIEHFGDFDAVARSLDEAYRVLRPGGILSVATEFLIEGPTLGEPGLLLFDRAAVYWLLLGERDWLPVSPIDLRISDATIAGAEDGDRFLAHLNEQMLAQGGYFTFKLEFDRYPQLVQRKDYWCWTSMHLAFRKPERAGASMRPRPPVPVSRSAPRSAVALGSSKACNLEDFSHPQLEPVLREVFAHEEAMARPEFPRGHLRLDHWQSAMTVRAFAGHGLLDGVSEIVGVGAGDRPLAFHLTRHVGRVFAADRYLNRDDESMLTEPERHWPYPWSPRRLVVQQMDPRELQYETDSMDGLFACDVLDRAADLDAARRTVSEMHRVLRPGGVLTLWATFLVSGAPADPGGAGPFTVAALYDVVFGECSWELPSPIDLTVSPATLGRESGLVRHDDDRVSTGVHLTLRKG